MLSGLHDPSFSNGIYNIYVHFFVCQFYFNKASKLQSNDGASTVVCEPCVLGALSSISGTKKMNASVTKPGC